MSKVIVSREKLVAAADAIREKTKTTDSLTLDEMPQKIMDIGGTAIFEKPVSFGEDIPGKYVNQNGVETVFSTWSISPYFNVKGYSSILQINGDYGYFCLYDDDFHPVKTNVSKPWINIPDNAAYFRTSNTQTALANLSVYVTKTEFVKED